MTRWTRVSRDRRCPVCGRPDWCAISHDGSAVLCQRVESDRRIGESGWLHRLDDGAAAAVTTMQPPPPKLSPGELVALTGRFQRDLSAKQLNILSRALGVTEGSLHRLGLGWSLDHNAYSLPMRNATEMIIGIRLRRMIDGRKFCVTGSRTGLFLPCDLDATKDLVVCEGESDTVAVLDLGLDAIGRPSCAGGIQLLTEFVKQHDPKSVTVMADAGAPGQRGAHVLASVLRAYIGSVKVVTPPPAFGDVREWKGQRPAVEILAAIDTAELCRLRIMTSRVAR